MGLPISQTAPHRRPWATILLVTINFIVFILVEYYPGLIVPGALSPDDAQRVLAMVPIEVVRGERLWTLFTAMFVHADWWHILGNMLFLFLFGGPVESAMGRKRFLAFYFASGLAADLFHILSIAFIPPEYLASASNYILNPWVTPTLGASGAISGVMGAYLIFYPRSKITAVYPIWIIPLILILPAWVFILFWFLLQLAFGLATLMGAFSNVAFWAHIGGFIAGIAMVPLFLDPRIKILIKQYRLIREKLFQGYMIPYRGEDAENYY
jgi:membrane associated rhomboid family serine protease